MSDEKRPDDVVFVSGKIPISRPLADEMSKSDDFMRALEQEVHDQLVRRLFEEHPGGYMLSGSGAPRVE